MLWCTRIRVLVCAGHAGLSVNDAFVMDAWGKSLGNDSQDGILMLGDGSGEFTRKMGLSMDAAAHGLGLRCKRYAMIVKDGAVTYFVVDEKGIEKTLASEVAKHVPK